MWLCLQLSPAYPPHDNVLNSLVFFVPHLLNSSLFLKISVPCTECAEESLKINCNGKMS